jgi:hypothetical protein
MARRRSSTGVTDFLSDLTDDIKNFLDDDVLDRSRDTERDVRRASRNLTRDDSRGSRRSGRSSGGGSDREQEIAELRRAVKTLIGKVNALADEGPGDDLPIAGYDDLTVAEIGDKLGSLTQADLEKIDRYERAHSNRTTLTSRIDMLRGSEPWPGFDEQTVVDIRKQLAAGDADTASEVRDYETKHKNRQGVLDAADAARNA